MFSPFTGRWRLLAFGFLFTFFSSFGQTFFISLFGGALRAEFALTNGAFGMLYSAGTLASALLLLKAGGWIDHVPLRVFACCTVLGLAVAALSMSLARHAAVLGFSFFLLRFFGQGLMTHVAVTTMARGFEENRGKAISIASLGHPAGEAVFPFLGVAAITVLGWRGGWATVAAICLAVVLPLAILLLRRQPTEHKPPGRTRFASLGFLVRPEMLLALPSLMASGFILTAVFFHQVLIANSKGWPPSLFAAGLALFGAGSIASNLAAGWMVDRFGARRPALLFLVPLAAGCFLLAAADAPWALFAYVALAGLSTGAYATVTTSLLAEAYGTERLGSIRATAAAVAVFSTALSPALFGVLVDAGIAVDVLIACFGLLAASAGLMLRLSALTHRRPAGELLPP